MAYFTYGEKETAYLSQKDKKLAAVIERVGQIEREVTPDLFAALISSIISQQISNKAAETVWRRFHELAGEVTPQNILAKTVGEIQACGISFRKAGYIWGIAEAAVTRIDFSKLSDLPDDEIVKRLTALKGVGVWTVEMLLIFSLSRPDVLSYGDLAIRRGMTRLYGLKELTPEKFLRYKKRYSPYGTVASLYLWELAHPKRA